MNFQNNLYQRVYSEYKLEKASDDSKKDLVKRVCEFGKNLAINYNPFIGLLPVKTQKNLKDSYRKTFNSLDTTVTTLASAIGLGLGAYLVGLNLDGFDLGFNMMQKIRVGYELAEMPKYISFPLIWGGFSKAVTDAVSYYFIATSAVRAAAGLAGRPLGDLVLESVSYFTGKASKRSRFMKEKEEEIIKDEKQLNCAKSFTEVQRKECEDTIAKISKERYNALKAGDQEKANQLMARLDSLIKNMETL